MEKKKIDVQIDGRTFTVVGSNSEIYVRELAEYVDSKIKNLTNKNDRLSQTMAATLAALNIADELKTKESELNELKDEAKEPLEKYENVISDWEKSQDEIKELKSKCAEYKDELLKSKMDSENSEKNIEKYVHALELKEKELSDSQKMIKSLQDKIFENQIELIEVKKELTELNNMNNGKNQAFNKEEI